MREVALLEALLLGGKGLVKEGGADAALRLDGSGDLVVQAVKQAGHAGKDGGLEHGNVLHELQDVA